MPVCERPFAFWNARRAASVNGPNWVVDVEMFKKPCLMRNP